MSDFTIHEVISHREFESKHGPLVSYKVKFSGDQGNGEAELVQKPSTPAPTPGEVIDANIEHTQYGARLKKIPKQRPGGGGGGKSPQEKAEIRRLAAQKAALQLLDIETRIALAQEGGPHDEHSQKLFAKLREDGGISGYLSARVRWFEANAREAEA